MPFRWKLRSEFFNGAGTYPLEVGSREPINIEVDELGYFTLEDPVDFALQVFAKPLGDPSKP